MPKSRWHLLDPHGFARNSDTAQFVSIALFSGIGLLISLIIVILRHARRLV